MVECVGTVDVGVAAQAIPTPDDSKAIRAALDTQAITFLLLITRIVLPQKISYRHCDIRFLC